MEDCQWTEGSDQASPLGAAGSHRQWRAGYQKTITMIYLILGLLPCQNLSAARYVTIIRTEPSGLAQPWKKLLLGLSIPGRRV